MLSDQRNEKKDAPEADVRGTSAEAEQRPAQSERLSQLSESLPEWRIRRNGGGAERFVVPFATIAAKPDEDAARMEQVRGHTADHLFKNNRPGSANQTFSCGSVSAEMAIRSAARGTSTNFGFKEGDLSCFCSARAEMHCEKGGAFRACGTSRTWERL